MTIVTCHSQGCVNNGIPISVDIAATNPDTGQPFEVGVVMCGGGCGERLTDVVTE